MSSWGKHYDDEAIIGCDTRGTGATFYAQWEINQYTITFSWVDNTNNSITQDFGTEITAPADPIKEGFVFAWWNPEIPSTMPAEDLTINAIWKSTAWDAFVIHALPVKKWDTEITEQSKENWWNGTYSSADGDYTVEITDEGKTITFSGITLKDPGAGEEWTASEGRPAGKIWFWVRFMLPEAASTGSTINNVNLTDKNITNWYVDKWLGIDANQVKEIVTDNNQENNKTWTFNVSWNGTDNETYKVIANLNNVTVEDENGNPVIVVDDNSDADKKEYLVHSNQDTSPAQA